MSNSLIQINPTLLVSKQFLSFLLNSDDMISRMILGADTEPEIFYLQNCNKDSDMISYIPKSKVDINLEQLLPEDFDITSYKIQNMKVGRIVSKLFSKDKLTSLGITSSHIEHFVNSYKSWYDKNKLTFRIVEGEEIRDWYDQDNYSTLTKGTLWNSCMRYKERLKFLDLYCKNPGIQLLILTSKENGADKLRGRALLWNNVESNDFYNQVPGDIKVMDRIYSILDSDVILFKNWAYENGYVHKLEQNAKSHLYFYNKNEILKLSLKIKLEKTSFRYYPYLDTFCYFNDYSGHLTNDNFNMDWDYKLTQANGNLMSDADSEENDH